MTTQTVWVGGREPVLAPASARVVHAQDSAVIATRHWTVSVLTPSGLLTAPDDETNLRLLRHYFPDLLEEDSGQDSGTHP